MNYRPELTNIEGKNKVDIILFEENYVEYDKLNSVSQGIKDKLVWSMSNLPKGVLRQTHFKSVQKFLTATVFENMWRRDTNGLPAGGSAVL